MRRVVSLYLPTWPTDRLRRQLGDKSPPLDQPLVLAGRKGQRRVIAAVDRAAHDLGLTPDLTIAHAQARVPDLHVMPSEPQADVEGLEKLAVWTYRRYSPVVALDPPNGLLIDIEGAAHLHDGEASLSRDLLERLGKIAIGGRIGVADTVGSAHAVARFADTALTIVPAGDRSLIKKLPIAALRLNDEQVAGLRRVGFNTIGELAEAPRAPIALRFGSDPGIRMDQAFGRRSEPLVPVVPEDLTFSRRAFAEPIGTPEDLARAIGLLSDDLCLMLEQSKTGARRLDLVFLLVDNSFQYIRVGTAKPSRDSKRLSRLLTDRLETVDPGFGVEAMTLSACLTEPLGFKQSNAFSANDRSDITELVDLLSNRIGADRLYRLTPMESDLPERATKPIAPLHPATGKGWPPNWPRPGRLLSPPEPVDTVALLPDQPPVQFTWRGIRRRIRCADGPERVFGEWWKRDSEQEAVRDYFVVEDEAGERFWLFRRGDGEWPATGDLRWYIHGVFA